MKTRVPGHLTKMTWNKTFDMQKLKYLLLYALLIIVVAFRLKMKDHMDAYGLGLVEDDNGMRMNYLGLGFNGFEGSVFLFLLIGLLFLFFVYDFLNNRIQGKFFVLNGLLFSFALFAFSETMIRLLSISLIIFFLVKLFTIKQLKVIPNDE